MYTKIISCVAMKSCYKLSLIQLYKVGTYLTVSLDYCTCNQRVYTLQMYCIAS